MKYINYIIIILSLCSVSCSSNWHLNKAVKKNPNLLDSFTYEKQVVVHDTIYDTTYIPVKNFNFDLDSAITDSFSTVYEDSNIVVEAKKVNNKVKLKGQIKPQVITKILYKTKKIKVPCDCPPQVLNITNKQRFLVTCGYLFWLGIVIGILIFIFKK